MSPEGVPIVELQVGRRIWPAILDTGFNGDVELPESLKAELDVIPIGVVQSILAAGRIVDEDCYLTTLEFDGELRTVEATFAPVKELLIGTGLMSQHHLEVDVPKGTVWLSQPRADN